MYTYSQTDIHRHIHTGRHTQTHRQTHTRVHILRQTHRCAQKHTPPFPQIDIIRAVVIVWRVRGKIIRSVLCNIVCNNCTQCNAHTYEQT